MIGVDLGGTKTEVAVLDAQGAFVYRHREATPSHSYPDILQQIAKLVRQARSECGLADDAAVGIGILGCIDAQTQRVRGANTQTLNGQALQQDLQHLLRCPVQVENDANCLALSESIDGAAAGAPMVFAAILGTGCGGGLTWSQQVWRGTHAIAGEWGHNPLPWPTVDELHTRPCWCGQTGCIETWISGPGFAQDHARVTGQSLTPPAIIDAMRQGDGQAQQSFERYLDRLGRALAQVVNLLDPAVIVLGGGMSNVTEIYERITPRMARHTFTRPIVTPVRAAKFGDSSGIRGAAWLTRVVKP
jgi:fructokinase